MVDGWVEGGDLTCVLLVDATGHVVGAGGHGPPSRGYGGDGAVEVDGRTWFSALAPTSDAHSLVLQMDGADAPFVLPVAT